MVLLVLLLWPFSTWGQSTEDGKPHLQHKRTPAPTHTNPSTADITGLFITANQSYHEGNYEMAARMYEEIITSGHLNGTVFYNLGNSYVRTNQIGKAISAYQKALLLLPRDEDCKANLRYVRARTVDKIEGGDDTPLWHTLAFWYVTLNYRELALCFLVVHAICWLAALVRLYYRREWLGWVLTISLVISLTMGVSAVLKYRATRYNPLAVVIAKEVSVRSGCGERDTVLFVLHEGTELKIIGEETHWYKIKLPDGRKGWLKKDYVDRIALPI